MSAHRITVEGWDPDYGAPLADELAPSAASVDAGVELPPEQWRPCTPDAALEPACRVVFVDGVRRIDALVWITADDGRTRRGVCASYAAGVVHTGDGRARVGRIAVRRGLFTNAAVETLATRAGAYTVHATAGDAPEELSLTLQQRLRELEVELALGLDDEPELVVVDGPLAGRQNVPRAVGYVKTHRVSYLPESLTPVVARLRSGERTPLFVTSTSWTRYSWYLRLPGAAGHPWAGVVRVEASAERPLARAVALADLTAATLVPYASVAHKDPRAPQNLFPIGGLERALRRRLGDAGTVVRALRRAAAERG